MPDVSGRWRKVKKLRAGDWGFALVKWTMPEDTPFGPFPMRWSRTEAGRNMSLLYPCKGTGWYHTYEVAACPDAEVIEAWVLEDDGSRPFAWVEDMARIRLDYKQAGDPRAVALKYGLNAMYGKLAQRTGKMQFRSTVLAAAITSRVRSILYQQARRHRHDIFLLATDGIISNKPLQVTVGPGLGEWEVEQHTRCFVAQAGVYWLDGKLRVRGFELRNIDTAQVEAEYSKRGTSGPVDVKTRRFIGYRSAMSRNNPGIAGTWEDGIRTLSLSPFPRRRPWRVDNHGATLTLPVRLKDWTQQAALDMLLFDAQRATDEDDQPEWLND